MFNTSHLRRNTFFIALIIVSSIWFLSTTFFTYQQHISFSDDIDASNFLQSIYSASEGKPLIINSQPWLSTCWPESICPSSFLSSHFDPILFFFTPIVYIFPSILTINILQNLLLALSAIPLYLFSRRYISAQVSFAVSLSFLLNPLVIALTVNQFKTEAILIFFLFTTVYALFSSKWKLFTISSFFTLICIEFTPFLLIALIPFYVYQTRKPKSWQFIYILVCILYYVLTGYFQDYFGLMSSSIYGYYWHILDAPTVAHVPLQIIFHPDLALQALNSSLNLKTNWLLLLFTSSAGLSLLNIPSYFLLLPWLTLSLFSDYYLFFSPYGFYSAFIVYGVFFPLVFSLKTIGKTLIKFTPHVRIIFTFLLILTSSIGLSQSIYYNSLLAPSHYSNSTTISWDSTFSIIPFDASVLSTVDVFSHIATNINSMQIAFINSTETHNRFLIILDKKHFDYIVINNVSTNYYVKDAVSLILNKLICIPNNHYTELISKDGLVILHYTQSIQPQQSVCSWINQ